MFDVMPHFSVVHKSAGRKLDRKLFS